MKVFEKNRYEITHLQRWELAVRKLNGGKTGGTICIYPINISTKDFYYMDVYETITSLAETYAK